METEKKMKKTSRLKNTADRLQSLTAVRAIRNGLVNIIPVLIIGAFALILKTFPIEAYQNALTSFAGGFLLKLYDIIYSATFGVLSLYMTVSISRSYVKLRSGPEAGGVGASIASLLSFFVLAGAYLPGFGTESMGPKSMFLAIITGLGASSLYMLLGRYLRNRRHTIFSAGADREFNGMLSSFIPITLVVLLFALVDLLVVIVFDVDSFRALLIDAFNNLFAIGENGFFKGLAFVFLSSLLWFFGIHGSDTLEGVMQTYFAPGLAVNQAAVAAGAAPATVLTKEFFDCFVLMGGCGSAICLLITILLFSRNKARRGLGLTAAFPMIFNINELMVFGLPIIFNPIMLIPFLLVPLVSYTSAYIAISSGIVPMITNSVEWTTPILLGGIRATGSSAGALLQLVNVIIGVLIYLPFVRALDKQSSESIVRNHEEFMKYYRSHETELANVRLSELTNVYGEYAKDLCTELRDGLEKGIRLAYQPQYNYNGECVGVEALLRWVHPVHGALYPPLVIKLAEEIGMLAELEEDVLIRALEDRPAVLKKFGENVKLSVNVTGTTIGTKRYIEFCADLDEIASFKQNNICLEVTEQAALSFDDLTREGLVKLRELGLQLAIDDFSMGQTSLHYLKDGLFDVIKLDGALIKGLADNPNYREIVSSIVRLSASLNLTVVAEFVETENERETLHGVGCDNYQGYLYSPAVYLGD